MKSKRVGSLKRWGFPYKIRPRCRPRRVNLRSDRPLDDRAAPTAPSIELQTRGRQNLFIQLRHHTYAADTRSLADQ